MIEKYNDVSAYVAAGLPTEESRVSLIESTSDVKFDGINVITTNPVCGDAVCHNGSEVVYFKGGEQLDYNKLQSQGYTKVGEVVGKIGNKNLVVHHAAQRNFKWCDCVQWAITAISDTSIKLNMQMKGGYGTAKVVEVTLSDTQLNATNAAAINTALNSAGWEGNVGYDNHKWWAFYDSDNSRIIIQNDNSADYRQYITSIAGTGTNITASLVVYGDMPATSTLARKNGIVISSAGLSFEKFKAYFSVSGTTPSANVALTDTSIVKLVDFNTSQYCATLREYYGTYDNYIKQNMVMYPQKIGVFSLPDGKTLTYKYGDETFTKKDGTVSWKYPAMHAAKSVGYDNIKGIEVGDWYLPGVVEAVPLMDDDNRNRINATVINFGSGSSQITNSSARWFSQRYNSFSAWFFRGTTGFMSSNNVSGSYVVQGVALL